MIAEFKFLEMDMVEYRGEFFSRAHGSPFDRGSADSYYGRPQDPHWYPAGTYKGDKITAKDMSLAEMRAYFAGYEYNERFGDKKDWG